MRPLFVAAAIVGILAAFAPPAPAAPLARPARLDTSEVRRWREDLFYLRDEMPRRHANLFHTMTRAQLDSAIGSMAGRLPYLARHQVIVELERLAARIGDGHSNVGPWRDSVIAFHTLPVAFYDFADGFRVRAADSSHRDLIGARVLEIGGLTLDSAKACVRPLVSRDNEMGVKAYTPFLLAMPEILHATGITPDLEPVRLVVEKDGSRRTVQLAASGPFPMLTGEPDRSWMPRPRWADGRDRAPAALWLSDPRNVAWFRMLGAERTLFCQINTIQHRPGDSLSAFMARAIAAADSAGAERFVLDLRLNGGGNGSLNRHVLLPLIKSRYDVKGRLYVLTGRRTWSAAQMLVTELEKYTNAIFVGEPTASRANHYGDSFRIVLPNSRVTFRVSTLWHQYRDARDRRPMIEPDLAAPLTYADYAAGRDAALDAAIAHRSEPTAASH